MTRVTLGSSVPVRCKATFLKYCSGDFGLDLWTPSIYRSSSNFHIWACLNCPRHALQFALCVWGKCGGVSRLKDSASPSSCLDCWMLLQISSFSRTTAWCRQLNENVLNASTLSSQEWFLDFIPPSMGQGQEAMHRVASLRDFLVDLAIFARITADIVENLHGFCQAKLHRFRGMKPTEPVAQEVTLWGSITASFRAFRNSLWERIGDKVANNRLHRYGKQGQNQYSKFKENPQMKKPSSQIALPLFKLDMACAATPPKPKKLSGYLVPLVLWPCSFSISVQVWGGFMFN